MSVSLSAERDRLQRQVEELQESLSLTHTDLELLSSETDDESSEENTEEVRQCLQSAAGLLAERERIQEEIQNLENALGPHSPISVSDDDSSSSEESELGLSPSVDSCLQMNLVYQQVIQETLEQLEVLLEQNHRQQTEVVTHLSGPIKEHSPDQATPSSCHLFLGRFLKPYFKDKVTGLGPPSNPESRERTSRMTGCLDNKRSRVRRWENWQKTLLVHSVSGDGLRRLIQPKLSRVDYLAKKLSSAQQTDRLQLTEQIEVLEREIDLIRGKKEEELIFDRHEQHDWEKISNIDFEGTRDAEDIRCFWQNFLHPYVNKSPWSQEEVLLLKEVCRRHGERQWENIAMELGTGRTAFLCLQTFQRFASDSLRRGSWAPAEDAQLRELVEKMRIGNFIPYTQISYFMEGRDPTQLVYRWNQVLDPQLRKGQWTQEEDQLLLRAVALYGERDWWKIRMKVPGRHDGACRDRYYDCLKAGTKRTPFDEQELELLLQLVEKHGVGRWSKIAAEIPNRLDAQCLREWRKLNRKSAPRVQRRKKAEMPAANQNAARKRNTAPKRKKSPEKIKLMNLVEEEEAEMKEEAEMVVEYMDTDEEEEKKKKMEVEEGLRVQAEQEVEVEEEEVEVEYFVPAVQEWSPIEKTEASSLIFSPVELPSSGGEGPPVRSTILGRCGRSVIIGPPPKRLPREKRHSRSSLMMATADQLRAHLSRHIDRYNYLNRKPTMKVKTRPSSMTDRRLNFELQAALLPWIGNLLVPRETRSTAADVLRETGEKKQISSTPIFLLLLQALNVDSAGCKEMIEQRRNKVSLAPPQDPYSTPRTVAGILQERTVKEEAGLKQNLILKELQKHPPVPPSVPFQDLLIPPRMPPRAVFIPQLRPPSAAPPRLLPVAPPPALQKLAPLFLVPVPLKAKATCPSSVPRLTGPSSGSASTGRPRPDPRTSHPLHHPVRRRRPKVKERQQEVCCSQSGVDADGPGDGLIQGGRRSRKPTMKAKVLQEAAEAKAEAVKRTPSSRRKEPRIQNTDTPAPPHQVGIDPVPLELQTRLTGESQSFKTEPPLEQQAQPPSILANQNTAPSDYSLPFLNNEHDYSLSASGHTPKQNGRDSMQPSSAPKKPNLTSHKYDSTLTRPPKAPRRSRTRMKVEEQLVLKSIQDKQCVGAASEAVGGASDEVGGASIELSLNAKRVRKPSQRARALREDVEAKAEAKRKRKSSSPCRKRPRISHCKPSAVQQNQSLTPVPGVHLVPSPSMWVTSPARSFHWVEAPPQKLQVVIVPHRRPITAPRLFGTRCLKPVAPGPVIRSTNTNLDQNQSGVLPAPPATPSQYLPLVSGSTESRPKVLLGPVDPPSLRKVAVQFDPSLMFRESRAEVSDWLSGRGGVAIPGAGVALPYLPPFISSMETLSALLRTRKSLIKESLQLLPGGSRLPQTTPPSEETANQLPDLPDSTSDGRPADTPVTSAPSVSSYLLQAETEEVENVAAVRKLVAELFATNPAYNLLKARFLSCFTLPALLATSQPIPMTALITQNNEEEEEEGEELKKIKEIVNKRRAVRSLMPSGASANHLPETIATVTPSTDHNGPDQTDENQTGPVQTDENQTGPDQTDENQTGPVQTDENQTGPDQTDENQTGPVQTDENQTGPDQTDENQTGPVQTDENQTGPDQTDENQTGPVQTDENQTGPDQTDENQTGPVQTDENQTGPVQTDENQTFSIQLELIM